MIEAANINTKFTHISVVLKQNEVPLLYINGRRIDTDYVNDQNTRLEEGEMTLTTTTQTVQLNYDSNGIEHSWTKISVGGRKKALIDELRLYAKALAAEEIFTDFRRYLRGNESDLHVYLRFNEGRGKFAYDLAYKGFTYYGNDGRFVEETSPIEWASDSDQLPEAAIRDTWCNRREWKLCYFFHSISGFRGNVLNYPFSRTSPVCSFSRISFYW